MYLVALSAEKMFKESTTPAEKAQEMEDNISSLVEESTVAFSSDIAAAKRLASEALKIV